MDTVDALVEAWTSTVTSTELQGLLAVAGVPSAPVQTLRSLFTDEHVRHRGILRQVPSPDGEQWVFGHPIRMGTSDLAAPMAAPMLGEHSEALLKEKLDLSDDQIALLREGKII
jgi:crotonobetainyl-CoA:carnitine CoA-transferase CaiB-like acyl-CoA transferase